MVNKIFVLCILLSFGAVQTYSQTQEDIKKKLEQQGIKSEGDVQKALKQKNMTEDDARKLAKQYGMDYDQFINSYILGKQELKPPQIQDKMKEEETTPEMQPEQEEITQQEETEKKEEEKQPVVEKKTDGGLSYFGYSLFQNIPKAFEPTSIGPIDPGYLIGPGDVLRLSVWGAVEIQYELDVDNQGTVFIPTAGQFFVSGVAYSDLKNKMTAYLSQYYEGLAANPPTVFLDISLAKLKPIKIFVMGEVNKPGGYTISSFATVFNALYSVGGPLTSGSLREIRVLRNNKLITKVDIYDYLLKGQLLGDVRLQNNDMIFIPPRGKTVSVAGEVLRPAIYELKEGENLKKLLEYSGGLQSTAYIGRVQVSRIKPFELRKKFELERELIDVDLKEILMNTAADFSLSDGDKVAIYPISENLNNYVSIQGAVLRPGVYDISKVRRISDLVYMADGVLPDVYYSKADILRTNPDQSYRFISIDLGKALSGDPEHNIELMPRDSVKIYSIYDLVSQKTVSISGYVKQAVTLPYADSLTLYDMVFRAGGLQDPVFRGKAYLLRGDVVRLNPDGLTTRIIPFDLEKLLRERTVNIDLAPGDKIYIYRGDVDKVLNKTVTITGEVKRSGVYDLNNNMTPMDLILRAGGFTEKALRTEVYVNRIRPGGFEGDKLSESFLVSLPPNFERLELDGMTDTMKAVYNFVLQHKDVVAVRKNPNYEDQRLVAVTGAVNKPGTYVLENRNESLLDLMNKASGPTSEAFLFGSIFKRFGKRLVVNLETLYDNEDEDENVQLLDGDSIYIPKKPYTISIEGEVNNPGLYKYIPGIGVKDYIDRAGGTTDSANYIIYQKANGESQRVDFGLFSSNPNVFDGSYIVVTREPPEIEKESSPFDLGTTIKDMFTVLVAAVTIWVLAKQL